MKLVCKISKRYVDAQRNQDNVKTHLKEHIVYYVKVKIEDNRYTFYYI